MYKNSDRISRRRPNLFIDIDKISMDYLSTFVTKKPPKHIMEQLTGICEFTSPLNNRLFEFHTICSNVLDNARRQPDVYTYELKTKSLSDAAMANLKAQKLMLNSMFGAGEHPENKRVCEDFETMYPNFIAMKQQICKDFEAFQTNHSESN